MFRTAFSIAESEQNLMGRRTEECESHVSEVQSSEQDPEYRGARGIPWEAGGTTLQAKILPDDR